MEGEGNGFSELYDANRVMFMLNFIQMEERRVAWTEIPFW